ncbi:MAG: peroxiredoxin [Planctomycetota bacterium]
MKAGDAAPEFQATDHSGARRALADFQGRRVVLWFYPKADTPGCSREGCGFRDLYAEFQAKGAEVLGVSYDTPADNAAFVEKYGFPYPLLSDTDQAIAKAYGAYDPAQPGYPRRNTYVIGGDGKLEQVLEAVNPKTHPRALLDSLGG